VVPNFLNPPLKGLDWICMPAMFEKFMIPGSGDTMRAEIQASNIPAAHLLGSKDSWACITGSEADDMALVKLDQGPLTHSGETFTARWESFLPYKIRNRIESGKETLFNEKDPSHQTDVSYSSEEEDYEPENEEEDWRSRMLGLHNPRISAGDSTTTGSSKVKMRTSSSSSETTTDKEMKLHSDCGEHTSPLLKASHSDGKIGSFSPANLSRLKSPSGKRGSTSSKSSSTPKPVKAIDSKSQHIKAKSEYSTSFRKHKITELKAKIKSARSESSQVSSSTKDSGSKFIEAWNISSTSNGERQGLPNPNTCPQDGVDKEGEEILRSSPSAGSMQLISRERIAYLINGLRSGEIEWPGLSCI
jgi:hypothetical protein